MSMVGSPFGGCLKPGYQPPSKPSPAPEEASGEAPEGALSIKKFLSHKGKELKQQEILEDARPASVLQEYYRETVSEGSGQYDEAALRKFGSMVNVKESDRTWFEKQVGPLSDDFASTVYGVILQDAMAAMCGDPALAVAFYASTKSR